MKFPYKWTLAEADFKKNRGKVFSCFACGGGSTMGYKLAGYDVVGCNEIDPKMIEAYKVNHNPKYAYLEPIQTFKLRDDLPQELYELDILDGSPPCSSFSMSGNREKDWGKQKKFREGQSKQVLDTLFFDFIDLAKKLQPKVVVAENVKGLLIGNARVYAARIVDELEQAGYYVTYTLLNAADFGVPQKRERVFFLAIRRDLGAKLLDTSQLFARPKIDLNIKLPHVKYREIADTDGLADSPLSPGMRKVWALRQHKDRDFSDTLKRELGKEFLFSYKYTHLDSVPNTITARAQNNVLYDEPRYFNDKEFILSGSFPVDYDFVNMRPAYAIGMSVPPIMMAYIADAVGAQWLDV